ncbi:nuclear transport factor 2 family protein [Candidatus Woesearchaeota archaeon]|nr:nuclear transport factor 2 family protein [Candidatus Woesearchaeota archaeon]
MKNKDSAVDFLKLCVAGKVDEAYQKYVDMTGKHHNPFFPKGFQALKEAMKQNPAKQLTVKHVLEDGDVVAVHSHVVVPERDVAVVHLFRFKNGKIIEMWDCGHEIPKDSPNKDGAF